MLTVVDNEGRQIDHLLPHNVIRAPGMAEFEPYDFASDPLDQKDVTHSIPRSSRGSRPSSRRSSAWPKRSV